MESRSVGLIGVGLLGTALAERLLAGGFSVWGHDIDPSRGEALARLGGHASKTALDVARRSERLVLCLPTTTVVEGVLAQLEGGLRPGQYVIDTTTGDPESTATIGATLAVRGLHYLDATVAGSSEQMRQGTAVILVGGAPDPVNACADVLACLGREWFHLGGWGSGARMKLVANLVLGLNRLVLAEGLALARACGFDLDLTLRVLRAGPAYSRMMDTKGPKMIAGDFTPQARLSQHLKDVRLIVDQAERVGAEVPLTLLHRTLLERLVAAGFGDEDNSAVLRAYE